MTTSWQRRSFTCFASDQSNVLWLHCLSCYKRWSLALHCWGFPSTSEQSCYPEKLLQTPRTWEAATAKGQRQRIRQWRKQAPSHISASGIRLGLGLWLHEHFFGSHTSLCNRHLISPSPPLAFMWYYNESH